MRLFKKSFFRFSFFVLSLIFFVLSFTFYVFPLPDQLLHPLSQSPTKILDRHGKLLYEVRQSDYGSQDAVPLKDIPEPIIDALLATEDRSFYGHHGISFRGIARAAWVNIQAGKVVEGGSTITQQLVRLRLQPEHRGFTYKLWEMALALRLEMSMGKEPILEAYLNSSYFGQQTYGIAAASKTYFGKSLSELSLAESAFLVGLLQSPSGFNPYQHFDEAKARQEKVLKSLQDVGAAVDGESFTETIHLAKPTIEIKAPHFVFWVLDKYGRDLIHQIRDVDQIREIHTTLDLDLQTETERIVANQLKKLEKQHVTSAAVVVLDAHTGEVLTMVGSADYFDTDHDGQVNVAISNRQPGSALKPFTYALALTLGDTAATTVADIAAQFFTGEGNPYTPRNYDYQYHGLVRYREALANSYNIPAVKVLQKVGVDKLLGLLKRAGISTLNQSPEFYGIALTLGSGEVKLLELAKAYGIFARGGMTLPITGLLDEKNPAPERVLDPRIAWLITDILSDPQARLPEFGENSALDFDIRVAAKTGTTRNSRDNWTFGYTPDRIVGVWVGNTDNTPMIGTSGVTGAGPIFHEVMIAATKGLPPVPFQRPPGLVQASICILSGLRPTPACSHTMDEWFIKGTEPKLDDEMFHSLSIDQRNGLLAGEACDSKITQHKVFTFYPLELQKWARENGWQEPPSNYSPLCPHSPSSPSSPSNPSPLSITSPSPGDSFRLDPLIPDEDEKIFFEAEADAAVTSLDWFVNDEKVGTGTSPDFRFAWHPRPGKFEITARSLGTRFIASSIRIRVE